MTQKGILSIIQKGLTVHTSSSITVPYEEPGDRSLKIYPLVFTSDQAYGEKTIDEKVGSFSYEKGVDLPGPLVIAAAASKIYRVNDSDREMRMVVFGDWEFAGNQKLNLSGNYNFIVNTINWLSGQEKGITIRPPKRPATNISLTQGQASMLTFISVDLIPVLILLVGMSLIHFRRRR
jgi:hypothetical protein